MKLEDLKKNLEEAIAQESERKRELTYLESKIKNKTDHYEGLVKEFDALQEKIKAQEKDFNDKNAKLLSDLLTRNADSLAKAKTAQELEEKMRGERYAFDIEKNLVERQRLEAAQLAKDLESKKVVIKGLIEQLSKAI